MEIHFKGAVSYTVSSVRTIYSSLKTKASNTISATGFAIFMHNQQAFGCFFPYGPAENFLFLFKLFVFLTFDQDLLIHFKVWSISLWVKYFAFLCQSKVASFVVLNYTLNFTEQLRYQKHAKQVKVIFNLFIIYILVKKYIFYHNNSTLMPFSSCLY